MKEWWNNEIMKNKINAKRLNWDFFKEMTDDFSLYSKQNIKEWIVASIL